MAGGWMAAGGALAYAMEAGSRAPVNLIFIDFWLYHAKKTGDLQGDLRPGKGGFMKRLA